MNNQSPWLSNWFKTEETMDEIMSRSTKGTVALLVILYGISFGYDYAAFQSLGDKYPLAMIAIGSPLVGIFNGFLYWLALSVLSTWLGRSFGGKGTWKEVQTVVAWAGIPFIVKILLFFLQMLLFGQETFTSHTPVTDSSTVLSTLYMVFSLLDLLLTVWYYVILSKGLGKVHGFSGWIGFGVVLLSTLVILLILFLIGLIMFKMLLLQR
jgi:hypothetical protein